MPWQVLSNVELGFVEIVYTGTVTKKDIKESTGVALSQAAKDGFSHFLSDFSAALVRMSAIDIYAIPTQWESIGSSRNNRLAVVVPESAIKQEDSWFFEQTATTRGWNVRVFKIRPVATDWLSTS